MTIFTTIADFYSWLDERVDDSWSKDDQEAVIVAIRGRSDFPAWGSDFTEFLETIPDNMLDLINEKSESFHTGFEAAKQKDTDNPYQKGTYTYYQWEDGFAAAGGVRPVTRKIEFFTNENGMAVWAGAGRVLENKSIVDCPLDFGTDNHEEIYEAISEEISKGETEGSFSNEYEVKYDWEITND